MDIRELLEGVRNGTVPVDEALLALKAAPFTELGFAKTDNHRIVRQGCTEVVYGAGKTPVQCSEIVRTLLENGAECVMVTRCDADKAAAIDAGAPSAYHDEARILVVGKPPAPAEGSKVAVVTAGTSDIPVAEEAAVTAETMGSSVVRIYDAGVSGLHRILSRLDDIMTANVVVVVAGMEGALPSVVGGLVSVPVIAVPTSIGYGASFEGVTALLSMMNSCSSDVSVVNIDNGFGAGYIAGLIDRRTSR